MNYEIIKARAAKFSHAASLQRAWEFDVTSYYRWKALKEGSIGSVQRLREACEKEMQRIRDRWPNHQQAFE